MLKKCLVQCKWWVLSYILMGFIIQLLNQLGIIVFQNILDAAAADRTEATKFIIIYGMILGGSAILNYLDEYPGVYLSNSISENLKIMALKKIAKIDYQAYQEIGTGQMIKVIENGAAAGNGILFSFFLRTLHELLPTLIFSLLFISFYNSGLMLLIAGGYAVIFVITNLLLRYLYTIKSTILKEQEKMSRYSIRGFMELVVFRTNGRYDKEIDKLSQTARTIINKNAQLKMIHEAFFAIFELFITIIKIFVIIFGVRSMIRGETTLGVVVALFMFIDKIYSPIAIFNILFVDYKLNQVTYRRLEQFIHAPEDKNLDSGMEVKQVHGHFEFRNVSFHYGSVRILHNLSFAIEPGKSVAFVGLSGSGKSTIVKLIAGLLKKSGGHIELDGTEIDKLQLNRYYEHISYLSQDTPIFDTTIRGNVAFDNAMSDEEIYRLLEKVHMKDKIASLPEGLDALVGEKGVKLSGGERQRLAFARILAQKRNLLILDEAVSALDPITEKSIMETVFKEFRDKTVIIIAHRLECIKNVDKIIVVKHGRVVGEGQFEDLISHCDSFKDLWFKDGLSWSG